MATQLLAVGTTAASSSDFDVVAGTPISLALNDAAGPVVAHGAHVVIEMKDPTGQYFQVGRLFSDANAQELASVVAGPGTYRVSRLAGVSCGVFRS